MGIEHDGPAQGSRQIDISTRKQLDIYMNPQRQRLLREMAVVARPATCKELADRLGISASSVTHHMKKLESLGLVRLDHTGRVRGVTARYWVAVPTQVNLHMQDGDDLSDEKALIVDYVHQTTYEHLKAYVKEGGARRDKDAGNVSGDLRSGFLYLTEDEAREVQRHILAIVERHERPHEGATPWEFSFMWLPHREGGGRLSSDG